MSVQHDAFEQNQLGYRITTSPMVCRQLSLGTIVELIFSKEEAFKMGTRRVFSLTDCLSCSTYDTRKKKNFMNSTLPSWKERKNSTVLCFNY